jgi:PAS domain S-box-containing protein
MLIEALNKMIGTIQLSYREIKANEKNFRSLVESSDAFIFNLTPSGRIMSVNESFLNFIRIDRDTIIGETIGETFTDQENEVIWNAQWEKMTSSQSKVSFSFNGRNTDMEQRLLNVQLIPQFDESGRMTNVIGTFTDITELMESRKKIEDLLKNENERLEALVKEKTEELNETMQELMEREKMASLGSLVAGISHEINTPLGVAVTASSFLIDENRAIMKTIKEGGLTREGLAAYLENADESTRIIQNNLRRAADLIASFKNISTDQSTEKEERFNFRDYLQSILLMLKHEYKNTGHKITVDCPEDLFLYSYPGAYSQIFTNLIMNSLIHGFAETEAGEIQIRVIPNDTGKKKLLRIEYQDNGAGISKENLKHIFDPFFTTARGTGTKSGSGLGLNILYNLVTTKLGGTVKCKSDPGKGVLFIIELPYL